MVSGKSRISTPPGDQARRAMRSGSNLTKVIGHGDPHRDVGVILTFHPIMAIVDLEVRFLVVEYPVEDGLDIVWLNRIGKTDVSFPLWRIIHGLGEITVGISRSSDILPVPPPPWVDLYNPHPRDARAAG